MRDEEICSGARSTPAPVCARHQAPPGRVTNPAIVIDETDQLAERLLIDGTLEFDDSVKRNPVVVPAPGVELRLGGGAQADIVVTPDKAQQKPNLFLSLCRNRAIRA